MKRSARIPAYSSPGRRFVVPWVIAAVAAAGCKGDDGDDGAPGTTPVVDTPTDVEPGEDPPGLNVEVLSLSGGSGAGGSFQVGNKITVRFALTKDDGSSWMLHEMVQGRMIVSGPTSNYQRVLAQVSDVITASVDHGDGSYSYTFATAIPATYLAPFNDSASFGPDQGELAGQALLPGTYSLGAYFRWDFTVEGENFREAGSVVHDFLFGSATTIEPRAVVSNDNCNRCHDELSAHGNSREGVGLCLLCHTAGAEDKNSPGAAGGTPGASVDFRVMVHRIHAGAHLPSGHGVTTNPDGTRKYDATPVPYQLVGNSDNVHDYSELAFPVWPNLNVPMPRDTGYTALAAGPKAQEDAIRSGVTNCALCHGDPDDEGPLAAPAQGDLHKTNPTRLACGSCHDDVIWSQNYTANTQSMPAQASDQGCTICHAASGGALAVANAHLHPLYDAAFNAGVVFDNVSVAEAGAHDGDGTIDPGEKVEVQFDLTNEAGTPILASQLNSMSAVISGPTENLNLLVNASVPLAALTGASPYTMRVPDRVLLEFVGTAITPFQDSWVTEKTPHWDVTGALTSVLVRNGIAGAATTLDSAAVAPQNYVDVVSSAGFVRDNYVVIDDGVLGAEEYLRIQYVEGDRLWFGSLASTTYAPSVRVDHGAGASVKMVTLDTVPDTEWDLDPATGTIDEVNEFGPGAVLVSYTTDFVMPETYPVPLNASPEVDQTFGNWNGKSLVSGTYSLAVWGYDDLVKAVLTENTSYRATSLAGKADFLVGDATAIEPWALIESGDACYRCHVDMIFHGGGRRGIDTCISCHGTAGAEDRSQYVAGNAPATPETLIDFRELLHKVHMGEELANASTYTVVGFGSGAYPDNYTAYEYGEVVFPVLPAGIKTCAKCHGEGNESWKEPIDRDHPTEQSAPVKNWGVVCGSCHDSDDAQAHIEGQTAPSGAESCGICHGPSETWSVEKMHHPH